MNKLKIEYFAKEEIKKSKGRCCDTTIQHIFERNIETGKEKEVGKYKRNYASHGKDTFAPFTLDGKEWYALYSYDYETLSLMKLPSCKKIKDIQVGFCPTEIWVPRFHEMKNEDVNPNNGLNRTFYWHIFDSVKKEEREKALEDMLNPERTHEYVYEREAYTDFAFMAGCAWGDDCSWKIEMIDLSPIADNKPKKVKINDILGYWEMPNAMDLRDCITIDCARDKLFKISKGYTVWVNDENKWEVEE